MKNTRKSNNLSQFENKLFVWPEKAEETISSDQPPDPSVDKEVTGEANNVSSRPSVTLSGRATGKVTIFILVVLAPHNTFWDEFYYNYWSTEKLPGTVQCG